MGNLLSRKEAAARLRISMTTLDAERSRGRLAYLQRVPGGKIWIPEEAIEDYLQLLSQPAVRAQPFTGQTYRRRRKVPG